MRNYLNCVQVFQPGATPLIVVMRHQGIECNNKYDGGGVAEDNRTKKWYRDFAEAIGNRRAVLAFEPDGIGTINCLQEVAPQVAHGPVPLRRRRRCPSCPTRPSTSRAPPPTGSRRAWTARMLRYMGVSKVRGFMLNVTHHDWTYKNMAYGRKVSRMVGGKPFVISTSYNGRGPVHYKLGKKGRYRRVNVFCNPRYRGLGPKPNTNTQIAGVDAFLYLNRPGVSGAGTCNGGFKAGEWWPERALMYSKYATEWYGPPKGTRFGFPQRISLCALGAPVKGEQGYSSVSPEKRCSRRQQRQPVGLANGAALAHSGADAPPRFRAGSRSSAWPCPRPPPRPSAPIR